MRAWPVLLADDDENDLFFFKAAYEQRAIKNPLVHVPNGAEAIEYLQKAAGEEQLPCLLVTDLKMPKVDGFDLLSWLQKQRDWKSLPAVVMSSSNDNEDQLRALSLGAREYLMKPAGVSELLRLVDYLHTTWIAPQALVQESVRTSVARYVLSKPRNMRILLRQGGEYLQPSGDWGLRETARKFASSTLAYWWAKEQQLLGAEVLMAFDNPAHDFVPMRV